MATVTIRSLQGEEMLDVMYNLSMYAFHASPPIENKEEWAKVVRERKGVTYHALFEGYDAVASAASTSMTSVRRELKALQTMDDAQIVETLTQVKGIGRWTVEMLLMFRLGRPDILPLDDYGLQKGIAVIDRKRKLPNKKDMENRGRRWSPYRSVASSYLWRAADMKRLPA